MTTISVRDLRQRWPVAESLLQTEHELIITRDGQPIARLIRLPPTTAQRAQFDPAAHQAWQRRTFGPGKVLRWVDQALEAGRSERNS